MQSVESVYLNVRRSSKEHIQTLGGAYCTAHILKVIAMHVHARAVTGFQPDERIEHIQGPASARVTLVEYADFQSFSCAQSHVEKKLMRARYGQHIRFVYRHYPQTHLHPDAERAAEAAETAAAQGQFWPYCDLLFQNPQHLNEKNLLDYARQLNLDIARYQNEMNDHVYRQRIQEHIQSAQHLGLQSTPAFYVNGVFADVAAGLHQLYDSIDKALRIH